MAKFQETEGALRSLTPLIEELKKQVDSLAQSLVKLDSSTKSTAKSQSDLKTKSQQYTTTQKELIKLDKQLEKAEVQLTEEYKQVQKAVLKKKEAVRQSNEELKKQAGIVKQSGGLFKSMTKSILAAGAGLLSVNAAIGVFKRVFGNAFKTIKDFEKGMSEVRAITGATDEDFKALSESAKELGRVTPKTATEVAGLQKEFAKLGFSTAEILAATEATISLSIAAGADLSQSAKVAASTVRGFGLSATETQRVVDVMAKSFSSSALDINKFETAMATVAPTAKNAGYQIEDVTAMLGVLADAGIDASTSGTALRNIMLDMAEGGFTMEEALNRINTGVSKNAEALKAFGKRGATVSSVLADNIERTNELAKSLDTKLSVALGGAGGAAQNMADIMADNLAGDIDKAKSAWEGMILSMEDGQGTLNTIFRGAVQSYTKAISDFTLIVNGRDKAVKDQIIIWFKEFTDAIKKQAGAEEALAKASKIRNAQLAEINELQKALNLASGRRKKDILEEIENRERVVDAQKEVIRGLESEVQANKDAIAAAEKAEAEAEANRLKAAKEAAEKEAKERAEAKERIELKAAQKRADFLNKIGAKEVDDYIDNLERENQAFEELLDERGEISIEGLRTQLTEEEKLIVASAERRKQIEEQTQEGLIKLREAAINAAEKIVTDRFNAGIDERLNSYLEANQAEQDVLKDKLDKGQISEAQYEKKVKDLKLKARQEEAKANKKKSQFDNVINTLVAISKTFATLGFPAGVIPAAIVAGIGAANGIAIAAEPIPKFKYGVKSKSESGWGIVGDAGREIIKMPGHAPILSPNNDTMMYMHKGTEVIPNEETERILSQNKDNSELIELKKLNKNISNLNNGRGGAVWTHKGLKVRDERNNVDRIYIDRYR